jgi:hypothetical protein
MPTDQVPKEFFDLVDRFIHLANDLTRGHHTSRVSSVIMYAAARYNAHCFLAMDQQPKENRAAAVDYFLEQYQMMLEENVDRLSQAPADPRRTEPRPPWVPPSVLWRMELAPPCPFAA